MGQLETLEIPFETVTLGSQSFKVYGLALPHITHIVRQHREVVSRLYEEAIAGKLGGNVEEIALSMLDDYTPLASLAIACGMDEPQNAHLAAKLPFSVQVDAIEKIIRLTLIAEGGLEKLMEIVVRAASAGAKLTNLPKA
jgi:hypothetical protein